MENKNKKTLIISITAVVLIIILAILGAAGIYNKRLSNEKKQNEDNNQNNIEEPDKQQVAELTEEEIYEILSKYGEMVSSKLTDYVKTNEIPTWEEFKNNINDNSITCDAVIDKDAKEIRFTSCVIEEKTVSTTLSVKFEFDVKEEYKYKLDIYKHDNSNVFCEYNKGNNCTTLALSIATKSDDTEILDTYSNLFVLYKDGNDLYVYNNDNKKSYKMNGVSYNRDFDDALITKVSNDYFYFSYGKKSYLATMEGAIIQSQEAKYNITGGYYARVKANEGTCKQFNCENNYGYNDNYLILFDRYYACYSCVWGDNADSGVEKIYDKKGNLIAETPQGIKIYDNKIYYNNEKDIRIVNFDGSVNVFKVCDDKCWLDTDGYVVYENANKVLVENLKTGKIVEVSSSSENLKVYNVVVKFLIYDLNNMIMAKDLETEKVYEITKLEENYTYASDFTLFGSKFYNEELTIYTEYDGGSYYVGYTLKPNGTITSEKITEWQTP